MQKNFIEGIKEFINKSVDGFKKLDKNKKYAIGIGVVAIVLAIIFSFTYSIKNKYGILFSGLDTYDAANISKALEDKGVETKIEGNNIYVPKEQVDRLRLELSATITNGSKGFELMDEGSSLSMTDEEFQIKKLRMLQGELEKTIKTFTQVEDARVHITQGKESVFTNENKEGKAAVYVALKAGGELDESQIKSIMSLVSASSTNVPKQNIEVIDQNMNLLSEDIYDENGNPIKNVGLASSRSAERELNEELQKSVVSMLEPIFGKDKVKATVNANLNFDTVEKSEIKIDPDKVIKSELRTENSILDSSATGSPVDNNMNNTGEGENSNSTSREEQIEYEVGRTETKTITTTGEVKRITASVAIDGDITEETLANVEKMVLSAIGMDINRGDQLSVVAMKFNGQVTDVFADDEAMIPDITNIAYIAGGLALLILIIIISVLIYRSRKGKDEDEIDEVFESINNKDIINEISQLKEEPKKEISLEDEIKLIVSKDPEEVTKLIKTWIND
ncbi:Flagellar M-ring protein [uncultured Clostridium sp.]|uniref:flagellar basal-body MS-ring/collar protein FliF n=1 Tax=uncultured Clostridium sp. TaxID=59620 RepID=UPI0008216A89|nr:flagellar basal-body MS-ring/collar protein FliF [uncultured Clostridium sp.]SCJ98160.1 Flagellar M-ring protein [uncultured Clostridium sp.]